MKAPINHVDCFTAPEGKEGVYHYWDGISVARCTYVSGGDEIYIDNFIVRSPKRGQGYGRRMIKRIREAFPKVCISIETFESSRTFWNIMQHEGYINKIKN